MRGPIGGGTATTEKIKVPLVLPLQTDGYSCVPRCVKMILDYISGGLGGKLHNLDVSDIGEIIETRTDGTLPNKITNLNKEKHVLRAVPSIEFEYDQKMHTFAEIEAEMKERRPVIAWVELSEDHHRCAHAVVVTGIDKDKSLIYYNDPIFGEKEEEITVFVSRWDKLDRTLVKVKIGQKRILDEFIEEGATQKSDAKQEC